MAGIFNGVVEKGIKTKVVDLNVHDIIPNELNHYSISEIDELAESIKLNGLQEPLRVYKNSEGKYTLVSGHRRHQAKLQLANRDKSHEYVQCIVMPSPDTVDYENYPLLKELKESGKVSDEELANLAKSFIEHNQLILSNQYRQKTKNDTVQEITYYANLYDSTLKLNPDSKPLGLNKADFVANNVGISRRMCDDYLNILAVPATTEALMAQMSGKEISESYKELENLGIKDLASTARKEIHKKQDEDDSIEQVGDLSNQKGKNTNTSASSIVNAIGAEEREAMKLIKSLKKTIEAIYENSNLMQNDKFIQNCGQCETFCVNFIDSHKK